MLKFEYLKNDIIYQNWKMINGFFDHIKKNTSKKNFFPKIFKKYEEKC